MPRRRPHSFGRMPPAAEPRRKSVVAKVAEGVAKKEATHVELVAVLKTMLRPGRCTRWSTLRRMLALTGHRESRTHVIALAIFEVMPDAYLGREAPRGRGPRCVFGVQLRCNLEAMREAIEKRWEKRLDTPPEVPLISMEYKLPRPANDNGMGDGRLAELTTRVHQRCEDAKAYYSIATDYLFRCGWAHYPGHKAIWSRHCEGATKREIAEEVGMAETSVQSVLDFHRARAGITHR